MKEVSFKFIFFVVLLKSFYFSESVLPSTYNYVFNNYIPSEISVNNIGVKYSFNDHKNYFLSQNWISNNLYIGGYVSSGNSDKVTYAMNIGYKTEINYIKKSKIIYDFSIHNKNNLLDSRIKWKKLSLILDFNYFSLSYNYLLSKCDDSDINNLIDNCSNNNDNKNTFFIGIEFYTLINNNFLVNYGLKKTNVILYPYFAIRYNL